MVGTLRSLALLAALAGILGGCGVPSSHEICVNTCEASRRCGGLSDADAATCKRNCDAMKGAFSDGDRAFDENCKDGPGVRSRYNDCLGKECNKIQDCLADNPLTCSPK
jgi:hypothetical protein